MAIKNLQEKIKAQADSDAQDAINLFRRQVVDALNILLMTPGVHRGMVGTNMGDETKATLTVLAAGAREGWPRRIWESREQQLTDQIMGIMDPLNRVLNGPKVASEDTPAEPPQPKN